MTAAAGVAVPAVQPAGVAEQQALAGAQPEGLQVLAMTARSSGMAEVGVGGEPGQVIEPEPEACPSGPAGAQTGPR